MIIIEYDYLAFLKHSRIDLTFFNKNLIASLCSPLDIKSGYAEFFYPFTLRQPI